VKDLQKVVVGLVVLVIAVDAMSGKSDAIVASLTAILASVSLHLRAVLVAVALPTLLVGSLIAVSPWHRDLGLRLVAGALLALAVAALGPLFLTWLQGALTAEGGRLFGGRS
jgi:hypothetical protein